MMNSTNSPSMMVALNEDSVAWLLSQRTSPNESLDGVVSRLRETSTKSVQNETPKALSCQNSKQGKYVCAIHDDQVSAQNLYGLFGAVVDFMHERRPEVLDKLSKMHRSNARKFIARDSKDVHIHRTDLGTMVTNSGWWIDTNIGRREVINALKALCWAAKFEFGKDIRFPL